MSQSPYDPYTGLPYPPPVGGAAYGVPPVTTDPILVSIGDIHCTQFHVLTPTGTYPIAGTHWTFTDLSRTTREIPQWAVIVAIITAVLFCGLGLLFLLVKEDRTVGVVQVTVQGNGLLYTTGMNVGSPLLIADLASRVNYARTLAFQGS